MRPVLLVGLIDAGPASQRSGWPTRRTRPTSLSTLAGPILTAALLSSQQQHRRRLHRLLDYWPTTVRPSACDWVNLPPRPAASSGWVITTTNSSTGTTWLLLLLWTASITKLITNSSHSASSSPRLPIQPTSSSYIYYMCIAAQHKIIIL